MTVETVRIGARPEPLEITDLPTPEQVFNVPKVSRGVMVTKIMGPSMIALGMSIGSGEWLIGPSLAAKIGMGVFWISTFSIIWQTLYNMEITRFTLYCGEPVANSYLRLPGGAKLWAPIMTIVYWLGLFWPGWAATAATGLAAIYLYRIPGPADAFLVIQMGWLLFFLAILTVLYGYKIERTLEVVFWGEVIVILIFVVVAAVIVGKPEVWGEAAVGAFSFGYLPKGADIITLGAFAGYSAMGHNLVVSNYYKDKGYGVGSKVGFISAFIGGKKIPVSPVGKVFKVTPENLALWKRWFRIMDTDLWWIFCGGAFVGMFCPSIIVHSLLPLGTVLPGWGIAAHVSEVFRKMYGPVGFYWIGVAGVLILFTTQQGAMDNLVRVITDMNWSSFPSLRRWAKEDIRYVYYAIFLILAVWGCIAIGLVQPFYLILITANMAAFEFVMTSLMTLYVNRKYLPKELQPSWWRQLVLVGGAVVFATFFSAAFAMMAWGIKLFPV